ncbi:tyrosine-type recombinase/integrase [Budvicia aquatica]|uniref:Integrase n=1 Tax=Budvicia aquatica TaxID=82979 RepID=A0A2C6DRW7_9GAMM|nr:site-specific integrase [Budvicia aquatica]PHI31205.1 integrase [Budvicia aquatica]VFS51469.1 Putative prophage CPS-53 integrase [Budvicia aquatica]
MAISDSYLRSNLGKSRDKIEEKSDRDGLWVRLSVKGAVTFFYRYRYCGKQEKMTIGSYPAVSLKVARDEVIKWAGVLAAGNNPKTRRDLDREQISSQLSFESVFREWHSMVCAPKVGSTQIMRSFEIHVFPKIGKYPAAELTVHNWLPLLDNLSKHYSEITKRVISNSKQCYSWAQKRRVVSHNPLIELSGRDFGIQKGVGERVLDHPEIALFWSACNHSRLTSRNKTLLKLCLFYGCRIAELRLAKKGDFDLKLGVWTVPAENHKTGMKTKKPLIRPIIPEIHPLLEEAINFSCGDYIFSSREVPLAQGFHLTLPGSVSSYIYKTYKITVPHFSIHDLRRTARTNLSELTAPHIAEMMLGHKLPGVWAVYDKYNYLDEMKEAYSRWWERIQSIVSNPEYVK